MLRDDSPRRDIARAFEQPLARLAAQVVERRWRYLQRLLPVVRETFGEIFDRELMMDAVWESELLTPGKEPEHTALASRFLERLDQGWASDVSRGFTQVGPQRDDIAVMLAGRDIRTHASQGQQRATVLAFKIAEISLLHRQLGFPPLLILDDVSSELDPERNRRLFGFLAGFEGQVFLSTTHAAVLQLETPYRHFRVCNGMVTL